MLTSQKQSTSTCDWCKPILIRTRKIPFARSYLCIHTKWLTAFAKSTLGTMRNNVPKASFSKPSLIWFVSLSVISVLSIFQECCIWTFPKDPGPEKAQSSRSTQAMGQNQVFLRMWFGCCNKMVVRYCNLYVHVFPRSDTMCSVSRSCWRRSCNCIFYFDQN